MADADWSRWVPVLEKMLAALKALNTYLRGEIERREYCKRVGIADLSQDTKIVKAAVMDLSHDLAEHKSL